MKQLSIISIVLLVFVDLCYAQKKITWQQSVQILHENSITLKQSELREQISQNNVTIARGSIYPNLAFSANNQHTMGMVFDQVSGKLITGNQWSNYATGSLGTSLVIYQGGQKQNALKAEKLNLELATLDTKKLIRELEIQLLGLFTQTLINHDLWAAGESQLLLSKQLLHQEEVLVEVGKRTLIDLSQAKAKLANDKLNVVSTKNAYELSLMKLKQLLEMEESEQIEPVPPKGFLVEQIQPNYHLEHDPYIRLLDKQIELGELKIKMARSGYFPTISLNGNYGTNYSSQRENLLSGITIPFWDQFNQNRTLSGNVVISMPIFDGFRTKMNTRTAKINQQSLNYEKEKITRERKQVISQGALEYVASQEELSAIEAAYEANKANYEAIKERYNVGKSSSIDVYRALTEFNISEFRSITSRYQVFYKKEMLVLLDQ
ncbi:TolC family protein [Sphingobacterium anhuiense]|uniref:TolC family protein n=1 Tax=Sphingobacterium anhuiense TaxID=493780 RepID=UPI003C2F4011